MVRAPPQQVLEAAEAMGFHILATSRKKDIKPGTPGWRELPVPPMGKNDSLGILQKRSGALGEFIRGSSLHVS